MPDDERYYLPIDCSSTAGNTFIEIPVLDTTRIHFRLGNVEVKIAGEDNHNKFLKAVGSLVTLLDYLNPDDAQEQLKTIGITYNIAPKTCMERQS